MPTLTTLQPKLHKPKSKIRLRLGLTPPHPTHAATTSSPKHTHLSPVEGYGNLASSTSTTNSSISRADSRTAFTYDTSPSSPSHHPEFDTISYNTRSPESISFLDNHSRQIDSASASTLLSEGTETTLDSLAYPTPSLSPEPHAHAHGLYVPTQLPNQADLVVSANTNSAGVDETLHPHIADATSGADDIFFLDDQQLSDRFNFISEIGFGNWGSVWLGKPKHVRASHLGEMTGASGAVARLGKKAAASGGSGAGGKVAIKLVHRSKSPTTAARVRALWGEMKIIRSLRHEPHPSIIQFEAFVITPSYALVIMPHLSHLIPVCLPVERATPYFRQLASAVGYLHERGITHNDIKPANVLLSHNDVPVLVDFGFAQRWEVGARGRFLSSISWGTPEYLDPLRARGMPHDERASDVWSLGITLFEVLNGRTPFEEDDQEQFSTPEELLVYYERTRRGAWIGDWSMPDDMQDLLRRMIYPDPTYRCTAMQAYHHPALQPAAPSVIITPHFVRAAATFEEEPVPVPVPVAPEHYINASKKVQKDKKKRKARKADVTVHQHTRAATPTALGESIKQHTSVSKIKNSGPSEDKENQVVGISPKKGSKLVIKKARDEDVDDKNIEEDHTPTKITKPAQPLRISQLALLGDKKITPRTSNSQLSNLSRPNSTSTLKDSSKANVALSHSTSTSTLKDKRVSILSSTSTVPKNNDEAVLKTMRSLEGTRKPHVHAVHEKAHEALAAIRRPPPSPPRPKSLDSAVESKDKEKKKDARRSLGLERAILVEVREEEVDVKVIEGKTEIDAARVQRGSPRMPTPSPQKTRRQHMRPHASIDSLTGKVFPASDDESPLAELREKILVSDQEMAVRFRKDSGDHASTTAPEPAAAESSKRSAPPTSSTAAAIAPAGATETTETSATPATTTMDLPHRKSIEALALDNRLDKMSAWIKDVEVIIQDARKALAEGREPGLPVLTVPTELVAETGQVHRFGVTPDKSMALPAHLRTSSTQVEPATPPKWMTYAEAEEKVKAANAWMEEQGRKGKKERPSVGQVLKLFGSDREKTQSRSNTPDVMHVPLKPPAAGIQPHALRGAPSTPALRSSTIRAPRVPLRKSESNLRNFNTMPMVPSPSFVAGPEYSPDLLADGADDQFDNEDDALENLTSPRRVRYENLVSTEPGVVRQGDGWGSLSSGRGMMKPSSMASLREKARAFLGDSSNGRERHIVDLSKEANNNTLKLEKRASKLGLNSSKNDLSRTTSQLPLAARPGTPAAGSVLMNNKAAEGGKVKGWMKSLIGRKS